LWAIIHLAISEPPRLTMPGAAHRQVQMLHLHAAVDRHVVDALLRLMLDHVEEMLRPHLFDVAAELLEHLVNRHRPDRHRRGLDDRLANAVDVLAGRQVHHRVGAEVDRGVQLFQLAVDVAGDGRVADVGVHLAAGGDADRHRLKPAGGVDDVRRNDHPARGDFGSRIVRPQRLALGDVLHLAGDVAGAGMLQLGDRFSHRTVNPLRSAAPVPYVSDQVAEKCWKLKRPLHLGPTQPFIVSV
jgi:hypothetical protein